ncbi:hypothetical protein C8Q80DRAFT_262484 [Daedaleopsis nitida]|nr:hypothetical protein C8Q80DRAFT_262484 [Daedaleopsis nitida]
MDLRSRWRLCTVSAAFPLPLSCLPELFVHIGCYRSQVASMKHIGLGLSDVPQPSAALQDTEEVLSSSCIDAAKTGFSSGTRVWPEWQAAAVAGRLSSRMQSGFLTFPLSCCATSSGSSSDSGGATSPVIELASDDCHEASGGAI